MKHLFEICQPRSDILQGTVQESDFAADLAQVINGSAPREYRVAKEFFHNTHPTKGLQTLLKTVCQRLTGQGGTAVLRLDTQYGGGKTHSLIALTHAASGMPGVEKVEEFIDPSLIPQEKVCVAAFDGENADPTNGRLLGDGVRAYTPWGEIAYGLAGPAGYEIVRQSDIERVAPGADTIRELFADRPALILLDELSIYLRKIKGRKEQEQLTPFLTGLFKAVSSSPKACVVFTLAIGKEGRAKDAYAQENEFVAEKLEEAIKVAGRVATLLNPTTEQETVQVLRRRLFSHIDDQAAQEVISAYQQLWINHRQDLPAEALNSDQIDQFRLGFPFHPALMSLLTDKLSTLSTFQRVRGMLRLLTRTIADLWVTRPANTHALHLHHINPGYTPIRDEINAKLEMGRFDPVIENDVSSAQGTSLAQQLDARWYGGLAPYGSFVARNILWHTFAFNEALQGIDETNLRYSILSPGLEVSFIQDARQRFIHDSAYLDDRPAAPLRFLSEVNLTQLIRRQTEMVDLNEARVQLQDRIEQIFKGRYFNLILFPQGPYEVPDDAGNGKPLLVLLSYDAIAVPFDITQVPELVERIYSCQGSNEDFRHLKNNLVFLVADESKRGDMKEKVKYRLALEAMRTPDRLKQLPEHQQDKVKELHQRSEQEIAVLIQQCYRHLFYPSPSKLEGANVNLAHATIDLPATSQKPGDGQQQVVQTLINNRRLILADGDPPNPPAVRDATTLRKGQISTAELRSEFRKNIRLSIMIGDDPFTKMIRDGIHRDLFVYKYQDLLWGPGDPFAEIKIDEQAFVYTLNYATEIGIWPRQPKPVAPPVTSDPTPSGGAYYPTGTTSGSGPTVTEFRSATDEFVIQPSITEVKPQGFRHEAPLKQALTQIWEDARSFHVQKIIRMTLRVFESGDAFKLMGAIASRVNNATIMVKLEGSYETSNGSGLEIEFNGAIADVGPIKDFLSAQFRAAAETSLNTTFEIDYAQGLSLTGDDPEKLTEQLCRFATGTALVEAYAEGK
ncbi:ATP-binding protein [Synechocystis salina LEGE 00031]|uniref:ATP-binding protein n=3 Tax=Synechocystis TaxID=1142 RepID=A0ABR9VVK3_9SYNC|nr:DUF499 domain-containing protein [Synechocystis salina]MBE9255071.1 ATP-binding protein [Synechocystis salina LEGE 00031]